MAITPYKALPLPHDPVDWWNWLRFATTIIFAGLALSTAIVIGHQFVLHVQQLTRGL